jgi:hypothetical protein
MKLKPIAFILLAVLFASCTRPQQPTKDSDISKDLQVETKTPRESSPFLAAHDAFKYPNNPRSSDDWTRFRDGFPLVSAHFSDADVLNRVRLEANERLFLEKEVHLNKDEIGEVETTSFGDADAHYLDECFLLRDVARQLEVTGASPIEQAQLHFRWVMRNVILHESVDSWVPPAFVLRRGCGSAIERSLVFLALLRQSKIEGCLIVVPDTEPLQFLVAVHDPSSKSLRLFDPQLERALASKDGKDVATVAEVVAEPALVQASLITAEQTKKLEAWMVCPLNALSPRMLELEKGLRAYDLITLYLAAEHVKKELANATTLPIKVWNPVESAEKAPRQPPNSPTRALRLFLPKKGGGQDETNRMNTYNAARLPMPIVLSNYAQIKLNPVLLPRPAFLILMGISVDLLGKYDVQTRELYLRGRFEPMIRRQERIQEFATNDAFAGLMTNIKFDTERAEWQDSIRQAYANLPGEDENPNLRAKMLQNLQNQWSQDQFLGYLLEVDREDRLDRGHKKTVLTDIFAVGLRDYLSSELARSRASANLEKAARDQALLNASSGPGQSRKSRVNNNWIEAKSSWGNFYVDRISLEHLIQHRLDQIKVRVQPQDLESRLALLEWLHLDVQKYFHARMRLADCLVYTSATQVTKDSLAKTKLEIETMEKAGLLKAEIQKIRAALPPNAEYIQKRLDLLNRDWTEHGNYASLKRQIDLRMQ